MLPEDQVEYSENHQDSLDRMKDMYLNELIKEQQKRYELLPSEIKTIYIWWGTPFQLWPERLFSLIDTLLETWDCEYLEELTIELNPDPFDEVLWFVRKAQKKYKHLFRLRFSFGIQSFDDRILKASGRNYLFNNLKNWLRELAQIKAINTCYNLDFMAFGNPEKHALYWVADTPSWVDEERLPWWSLQRDFFEKLMSSWVIDGSSVYTLELFPWSDWYYSAKKKWKLEWWAIFSDEETLWQEFQWITDQLTQQWFARYEISNFALAGKRSLHNMVYWNMWSYVWLWIQSSSFLSWWELNQDVREYLWVTDDVTGVRFKNTSQWKQYLSQEKKVDSKNYEHLWETELKQEAFILWLRTDRWVVVSEYNAILVDNAADLIEQFVEEWYMTYSDDTKKLILTDMWLDVYNALITELVKSI